MRDLLHPVPISALSADTVTVGLPEQLSVALAVPAAGKVAGLHPRLLPAGQVVNTGSVVSTV